MNDQEWVEKFYDYYNQHSFPIEHLEKVEQLVDEYLQNDPKGLRRFVKFLDRAERMTKIEKMGRETTSKHDISQLSRDLLMAYCSIYPEELPCLVVDIITIEKIGNMLKICTSINENWERALKGWDEEMKTAVYFLIDKDEEDEAFLKEKLRIDDSLLQDMIEHVEERNKEYDEKTYSRIYSLSENADNAIQEIRILTFLCRNSPTTVKTIQNIYSVNKSWLTMAIRDWKKEKLIQVRNKPLTLVKTKGLEKHLKMYLKPDLTDFYDVLDKKGGSALTSGVVELLNKLDEIVRNEGK